jgi:Nuclease-related domain
MWRPKRTNKRSPLKQAPLRVPGESLGQKRNDLLDEDLLPWVIAALVAVAFAGFEWWTFLTKAPPQPGAATFVAACAVAFGAYRFFRVRGQLRDLKLGMQGEQVVGQYLDAHRGEGWHVFHDVPGPGFNVDHVIVSPRGVFAVETKTFSKPARGGATVRYDGDKVLVNGLLPDRDPIIQARAVRDWIRGLLLDTTAIKYPVRGVVVFPGWFVDSPKTGTRPDVWVLNEKALVKFIENEPVVIKSEDVALAAARMVNYITM